MLYTSLAGGQSNTDPGVANLGFDGTTFSAVTQIYMSYFSPSVVHDNRDWITTSKPYYLRLYQKSNPENWAVYEITATTNHTNYVTLAATFYMAGTTLGSVGARGGLNVNTLGVSELDLVAERTFAPTTTVDNGSNALAADAAMASANTFYDGPNTGSLTGTYLVTAHITALAGAANQTLTARLWDGTTSYAEASALGGAAIGVTLSVSAVVTLSAQTLKISVASTNAGGTIKADPTSNSSGAHVATRISYVRIA
jgi:hypothetical protein